MKANELKEEYEVITGCFTFKKDRIIIHKFCNFEIVSKLRLAEIEDGINEASNNDLYDSYAFSNVNSCCTYLFFERPIDKCLFLSKGAKSFILI